ncbi:DUF2442 domain-containing protein [candidate division KSB1 bacterium]|nr:DUF2442 domain-containing protein [candidate division KSB1 bacterium]
MILHIVKAKYIDDYQIELSFNNGQNGVADLKEALYGKAFEPLKDKKKAFANFKIDDELKTITRDNNVDLAPEYYTTWLLKIVPN